VIYKGEQDTGYGIRGARIDRNQSCHSNSGMKMPRQSRKSKSCSCILMPQGRHRIGCCSCTANKAVSTAVPVICCCCWFSSFSFSSSAFASSTSSSFVLLHGKCHMRRASRKAAAGNASDTLLKLLMVMAQRLKLMVCRM